jgi:hypothetical protein
MCLLLFEYKPGYNIPFDVLTSVYVAHLLPYYVRVEGLA